MSEEIREPEEETEGGFQRINSKNTWSTSAGNSNGAAVNPESTPRTIIEVEPDCAKCGDALWILAASGNSTGTRVLVPCACQADVFDQRDRLRTYSQLGSLERFTFGTLRRNYRGVEDVVAFLRAKETARDFADEPKGWLVIEGSSGSGKTHFAVAIVNASIQRGAPAKYVSALDIPDLIRSGWTRGDEDLQLDGFAPLMEAPVLVIDDFGVQPAAEWVDAKIDQLLTMRFNSLSPTVVALAKPIDELPERYITKLRDSKLARVIKLSRTESDRTGVSAAVLSDKTFGTFDPKGAPSANRNERQQLDMAFKTAKNFVTEPENSTPWLYLQGETGVGKTHLAFAIAGASIDNGVEAVYWSLPRFLDQLRQTYSNRNEADFFALFDKARDAELLVLDDFGLQQRTDWSLEKLYQLIAHRHDRRLRTVIAGQHKIWDPDANQDNSDQEIAVSLADQSAYMLGSERVLNEDLRLLFKHQWRSIMSRLSDQHTVTVLALHAPDYRNRGV